MAAAIQCEQKPEPLGQVLLVPLFAMVVLTLISYHNMQLFHALAEILCVVLVWAMLGVMWHSYEHVENSLLMLLASGYLWVSGFDLLHTFAYSGLLHEQEGVLSHPEFTLQVWLAARMLEGLLLLTVAWLPLNATTRMPLLVGSGVVAGGLLLWALNGLHHFDHSTLFSLPRQFFLSELVILLLLAAAALGLYLRRRLLGRELSTALGGVVALTLAAELAFLPHFNDHLNNQGLNGIFGHLLKFLSFWVLYRLIIRHPLQQLVAGVRHEREINARLEAERRFQTLVANIRAVTYRCADDNHWSMEFISDEIEPISGYPASDFIANQARPFNRIIHPKDRERVRNCVLQALTERRPFVLEYRILHRSGATRWVHEKGVGVWDQQGEFCCLDGVIEDISERKQREQQLCFQAQLLASVRESLIATDMRGRISYWGRGAEALYGYRAEEVMGKRIAVSAFQQESTAEQARMALLSSQGEWHGQSLQQHKNGYKLWVESFLSLVYEPQGHPHGIVAIDHNISESRAMEQALQASEHRFRQMANALPQLVWTATPQGRVDFIGEQWCRYTGTAGSALLGEGWRAWLHPEDQARYEALWYDPRPGERMQVELRIRRFDGEYRRFDVQLVALRDDQGTLLQWLGSNTDIEERLRADEALRRAQKMEAIGYLTGGIAHDFNNILSIILGNLDLLANQLQGEERLQSRLNTLRKSAERAATLTHQLLSFSRQQPSQSEVIDLNQILHEMDAIICHTLTPQIRVDYHYAERLWHTCIDPGDGKDALLNLVLNARDALNGSGRLVIETSNRVVSKEYCTEHPSLTPGEYVELVIRDNGCGIKAERLEQIFEPFVTSKAQGTGLGLAMVYGFVMRSRGAIYARSEGVGKGAAFHLLLPRNETASHHSAATPHTASSASREEYLPTAASRETLLVVDDEPELLALAQESLEELGYLVMTASSGQEALQQLHARPEIALLFSDVVMPGEINGYQLAAQVRAERPTLPILLTSGYNGELLQRGDLDEKVAPELLPKPYTKNELARRVHRLLTTSPPSTALPAKSDARQLGIAQIDEEHRTLLQMIAEARAATIHRERLLPLLARLNQYTQEHFRSEEALMARHHYPGLENHRQVHRLLTRELQRLNRQVEAGQLDGTAVVSFLQDWMMEHTQVMDRAYLPFVKDER